MTGRTMSEADSKALLADYAIPLVDEVVVPTAAAAVVAAEGLGFPVVVKLNGERIAHKTERGLVRLGLRDQDSVHEAAVALLAAAGPADGDVTLLVARHVSGSRELIAGIVRDPQFGPVVMLGLGGVLTEALGDVAFRLAPLTRLDADELIDDLVAQRILGPFRGEPAVDRDALAALLLGLSRLAVDRDDIASVDINPLIVFEGRPVAVDALVELQSVDQRDAR